MESIKDAGDPIQTLGAISHSNEERGLTAIFIKINDKDINSIQSDENEYVIKRQDELMLATWNRQININDMNIYAYNENADKIYRYGYSENTNVFKTEELKWYEIN